MCDEIKWSTVRVYSQCGHTLKRQDSKMYQQGNINVQLDQTATPFHPQSFLFTTPHMLKVKVIPQQPSPG